MFLEILQNSQEKTCARVSFLIKLGLRPATLLKKRLRYRCFLVNFAKFLRTPFLQNTSGRLLLYLSKTRFKWECSNNRVGCGTRTLKKTCQKLLFTKNALGDQKKFYKSKEGKVNDRRKWLIRRAILSLCATARSFTSKSVQHEASVHHLTNRTFEDTWTDWDITIIDQKNIDLWLKRIET